ncbi:hypothetical protein GCM10022288_20850 [Gryllotalpicola kribbensis]|uniref:Uncharacterized protein n=1 Tax=Gryllotalpicola kribbensis TaxID=993084 RepID=A0ABP8AUF4_9MICO
MQQGGRYAASPHCALNEELFDLVSDDCHEPNHLAVNDRHNSLFDSLHRARGERRGSPDQLKRGCDETAVGIVPALPPNDGDCGYISYRHWPESDRCRRHRPADV